VVSGLLIGLIIRLVTPLPLPLPGIWTWIRSRLGTYFGCCAVTGALPATWPAGRAGMVGAPIDGPATASTDGWDCEVMISTGLTLSLLSSLRAAFPTPLEVV
jgi:hypothetical protein